MMDKNNPHYKIKELETRVQSLENEINNLKNRLDNNNKIEEKKLSEIIID